MSNIATTIVQSKHLLELGLDPKTADCMWLVTSRARLHVLDGEPISNYDRWENYPAWSLSALFEVMPKGTELVKMQNDAHELYYEIDYMYTGFEDRDATAAAYEMVCWLLEQGVIEKGGQDENN